MPRLMISRGRFNTPTSAKWNLPSKNVFLLNYVSSILQLFVYLEYRRNRNGAVKDDRKITSQMKVYFKLMRQLLNKLAYLIRHTLVANMLKGSYVHVETVSKSPAGRLFRTVNRQFNDIEVNFSMNKWHNLFALHACDKT